MLWNMKKFNDLPPTCDYQISLMIDCESIWLGLINYFIEYVIMAIFLLSSSHCLFNWVKVEVTLHGVGWEIFETKTSSFILKMTAALFWTWQQLYSWQFYRLYIGLQWNDVFVSTVIVCYSLATYYPVITLLYG